MQRIIVDGEIGKLNTFLKVKDLPSNATVGGLMKLDPLLFRRMLLVCAVLFVIVALVVALGVIPPVQADTSPGAAPERAVPAFWVNIGLQLLAAATLVFIGTLISSFIDSVDNICISFF